MPAATAAIIGSAILGAGASGISASKQRRSQRRIAAENNRIQEALARDQRIAKNREVEQGRDAQRATSRLAQAAGVQRSNAALASRGIAARPIGSFADVTSNVLDEGASRG